ncbi:T9SS type A sorting domain-containing protein [Chryseobacterium sp. C39-AII1]|uniref:T9SS type A sorting domain-containing protein n=1 Tax=Chryseobacterium sp. C39-AII1 TaxID=3080332 RepID=UPI00320A6158
MKKRSIFLIASISLMGVKGQTLEWQKSFGGSNVEDFVKNIESSDGNFVFTGSTLSNDGDIPTNNGLKDVFVTKIDNNGNYLWKKVFGGNNDDVPVTMVSSNDGGTILLSKSKSNSGNFNINRGDDDLWVTKLDSSGNIVWNNSFSGSGNESGAQIISIPNGYILTVNTNSNDFDFAHAGTTGKDVWVIRLDESGNVIWKKLLQGSLDEVSSNLKTVNSNEFLLLVNSASIDGDYSSNTATNAYKGFIYRMDVNGNILLNSKIESTDIQQSNFINDIKALSDGYIIGGRENVPFASGSTTYENYDATFVKISTSGNLLWKKTFSSNGPQFDEALFTETTTDNANLFFGYSKYNLVVLDSWMMKIDNNGNIIKKTSFENYDNLSDLKKIPSSGNFILSTRRMVIGSGGDFRHYVISLNSIGTNIVNSTLINTGQANPSSYFCLSNVTNEGKIFGFLTESPFNSNPNYNVLISKLNIPQSFLSVTELNNSNVNVFVYPNPTSDYIKISEKMDLLVLYDLTGRVVITAKNADNIDVRSINSGNYILQISNKKINQSFKIIKK